MKVSNISNRAWTFATGLVLGFSLLVSDDSRCPHKREAFLKSLHVLKHLKRLSPQAEKYYNILSSFHVAIKAYNERANQAKTEHCGVLVDRVFVPDTAVDADDTETITTQLPSPDMLVDFTSANWCSELPMATVSDPAPMDPTLFTGNDIIMRMLWESDRYAMEYPECALADADLDLHPSISLLDHTVPC